MNDFTEAQLDEIEHKASIALHHLTAPELASLVAMARRTAEAEAERDKYQELNRALIKQWDTSRNSEVGIVPVRTDYSTYPNKTRFVMWPSGDIAAQLRMQERAQLDPELSGFLGVAADRLAAAEASVAQLEQQVAMLREGAAEAIALLQEKKYGNSARSPGHNAQIVLRSALAATEPSEAAR